MAHMENKIFERKEVAESFYNYFVPAFAEGEFRSCYSAKSMSRDIC